MSPEVAGASTLELAHVLFMDIVGYSKLPIDRQQRLFQQLQEAVRTTPEFVRAETNNQLIRLPTGDGMALVFWGDPEAPARCALELHRTLRGHAEIPLRMGIHTGPVYRVEDINANRNVAGGGINIAQRIMDCGNAGHILVSESVADVLGQLSNWTGALHMLGEAEVKHGVRVRLFNLCTADFGNPSRPQKLRLVEAPRKQLWRIRLNVAVVALTAILLTVFATRVINHFWYSPLKIVGLAVLPFQKLNALESGEIDDLRIAVPSEIIVQLAKVKRIRLPSIKAARDLENQGSSPEDIGQRLETDYVLDGGIGKVSESFGIDVHLVRVKDRVSLWGEHYNVALSELPSLQDTISKKVASALNIRMSAAEQENVFRHYTENDQAYRVYLKGRALLVGHKERDIRDAADAFENALQFDDNNALAHAGLAMASAEMPSRFANVNAVKSWKGLAIEEANRALKIDPQLAEAHQALAAVYRKSEYNWEGTIREGRRALELNPNLDQPHYYIAGAFYHLGLLEAVDKEVRAGLEAGGGSAANPEDQAEALRNRGVAALLGGRFRDAVALLEEVQKLSSAPQSDLWLARAYYHLGRQDESDKMLEELTGSSSASTAARSKATLAGFLAAQGGRGRAEALIADVIGSSYMQDHPDHHVAHALADAYAQLGNSKDALYWLRRAAETGFPCYLWYAIDPLLDPMRNEPDFKLFLKDMRASWQAAATRYTPSSSIQ